VPTAEFLVALEQVASLALAPEAVIAYDEFDLRD